MIPQYLSELLLRFDSVILPGMGVFQLKNIPASIQGDRILPPGKILLFDPSVKNNDGVLANYISEKNRISFLDACAQILDFVENLKKIINEGHSVILEKIGVFKLNTSGSIDFIADPNADYNIDSFGLNAIDAIPLKIRREKNKSESKEFLSDKKKKFPMAAVWIIAAIVFLAAGITSVYFIKPDLFSKIGINLSPKKQNNSIQITEKKPVNENDSIANTLQSNENEIPQTNQDNVRYYIIAASFRIKENADNYVVSLNAKGHKSESFFMTEKNLYVVSYDAYNDKAQAEQVLISIKASGNQDAWILEK